MPKTRDGEVISWKEFMKRWKEGINMVTPLQRIKTQLTAYKIQLVGILSGIFVSIYNYEAMWWVGLILIGAIILTFISYNQLRAQKKLMTELEKSIEKPIEELFKEDCKEV